MKTKIIATVGPATLNFDVFRKLISEGVNFIRINTAYGDSNQYDRIIFNLSRIGESGVEVIFDIKTHKPLDYFLKNNLKYIALSFAENKDQIKKIREIAPNSFVISKIESEKGVENFQEILNFSDGIMIARGDLGEAVSLEKVPCLQKKFTRLSEKAGKFTIAATEMLLSMVKNSAPTRAEVSDVANAVFDNVDAVMLSEETAIGKYPVESVGFMRRIINEAENCRWD